MRAILMLPILLGLTCMATAQTPGAVPATPEPLEGRQNQKIERIRHEDAGSRIDEVRMGGQTQSITVQPKVEGLPAYEVQPGSVIRGRPRDAREGLDNSGGQRTWNVLSF
jgi:starvation-inducible outer membrane lipoprotein